MNLFASVASIMTTKLYTVSPEDNLKTVKEIFENHRIHHIPVTHARKLVGLISKSDFDHFEGGLSHQKEDRFLNESRLEHTKVADIMTKKLGKLEPDDRINVALEIFGKNLFHALPVVEGDELVGIVTPYDILKTIEKEVPAHPEEVYS